VDILLILTREMLTWGELILLYVFRMNCIIIIILDIKALPSLQSLVQSETRMKLEAGLPYNYFLESLVNTDSLAGRFDRVAQTIRLIRKYNKHLMIGFNYI